MNFEVVHVSRGDIRLKSEDKLVHVLGEALIASTPTEPSYVIYLNTLNTWEMPPDVALTEAEKQEVIGAIRKHFHDRGSIVEFE
ncbi:Imm74 family immunity protein [Massilia sp. DD77]|uniref:Imm74 family immunity protein n=1 Tax=Massilia sp. DD77 TaxID=3109349 RepID=UPI003000C5BA